MKNPTLLLKPRIISPDRCSHGPVGRFIKFASRSRPATGRGLQARNALFLITLLCAAVVSVQSAHAATITVQSTGDGAANAANCPGSGCRLRDALAKASGDATIDTIDFSVTTPATITLTSGQLEVNANVTISGPGANLLTVDANHNSRVFQIDSGKTVTISELTVTGGSSADIGGGVYNNSGMLTLNNSTVSGNSANNAGGGIWNYEGSCTINNSTVSGNSAGPNLNGFGGGGILNEVFGGGNDATVTINNSTVSGNSAVTAAGGILNDNESPGLVSATLTINNCTVSGNSAAFVGGILSVSAPGPATLTIGGTILKTGASGENIIAGGTVHSLGYNLSNDDASAVLDQSTDQNSTDPMLGPLQDNGGPTFTHALLTGSPAIDQGKNFSASTTDQRGTGFARTVDLGFPKPTGGDGTDIGSFEVQSSAPCPQGQGYWKNNPGAWPVNSLMLGSQSYTQPQLLAILNTPVGAGKNADASLILADQLIAAKLNIANGADGTPVNSTIINAGSLLSGFGGMLPYHVKPSTMTGQAMVNDAAILESFNKGFLTPGCGG